MNCDNHNLEGYCQALLATSTTYACSILKAAQLDSPLGPLIAIGDETALYLLAFIDQRGLTRTINALRKKMASAIIPGCTAPIDSVARELHAYFNGDLSQFETPLGLLGSAFQCQVWAGLRAIAPGTTCSYAALALAIGKPTAHRAVANANGANPIALIIPCHRVINSNGALGGYAGGIARKQWLIDHERR